MSIIPAKLKLTLYEGSTFDETWTFYADDAQTTPVDWTGWTAALQVRASYDGEAALVDLTSGVTVSPTQSGLVLGGVAGTVRVYVTDEILAALTPAQFTATTNPDGSVSYGGVWDLELTNAAGETFRYAMGSVAFSREVTQ